MPILPTVRFLRRNVLVALPVAVIVGGFPGLALGLGTHHDAAASRNAAGAALLARVVAAYEHVPGAIVIDRSATETVTFTQTLKAEKVVSEQAVATGNGATTVLVSRNGPPTFAKEPGTSCWSRLTKTSGQNLTDVGQPFLTHLFTLPNVAIGVPRRTATGWTVTVSQAGTTLTFTVARSMLLQSMVGTHSGQKAEVSIENLTRAPTLATPAPSC
jgi:hypothetical protein